MVQRTPRLFRWTRSLATNMGVGLFVGVAFFILTPQLHYSNILITLFVFLSLAALDVLFFNRIILDYAANRPTFWQRNRDAIVINMFSALFGTILGIIGTLTVQKLTAQPPANPPTSATTQPASTYPTK